MRTAFSLVLLIFGAASLVARQELPPPFPRTNATRLLETDRINVWDVVWPKGQPTALHRHIYDQVGTYYARGGRVITATDGTERRSTTEVGSLSTTRKGTTHVEEGTTDPPLRAVFIELKSDSASGKASARDATRAFPDEHATPVLDNERVRVWDYTWASGTRGLRYVAALDTVVVWLGEGTLRTIAGDGSSRSVGVKAGTMRYMPAGSGEALEMASGSPRTMFFQLK